MNLKIPLGSSHFCAFNELFILHLRRVSGFINILPAPSAAFLPPSMQQAPGGNSADAESFPGAGSTRTGRKFAEFRRIPAFPRAGVGAGAEPSQKRRISAYFRRHILMPTSTNTRPLLKKTENIITSYNLNKLGLFKFASIIRGGYQILFISPNYHL
jgi:hypothetical protein